MTREPYAGPTRKLLLAFDVGTTFSGVSYSVLDPGVIPTIKTVTRFPCQEQIGGDSKIPSILYYDDEGKVMAAGAEAVREGIEAIAEDEGWTIAEWFKLHIRPRRMRTTLETTPQIPSLPPNKTAVEVFADFLRYLYECTKRYIQETEMSGRTLWEEVEGRIHYVITHPNGWEGYQQSQLRRAAILAELIPDTIQGNDRVTFVTEGEASLHFCVLNGLAENAKKDDKGVLIIDAGGGTIDLSAYRYRAEKQAFEEISAPRCLMQGSVFVTTRAKRYLQDFLRGSRFGEDMDEIVQTFDKRAKITFRDDNQAQFLKVGKPREHDARLGIRSGQLKLPGATVASFFQPSLAAISDAIGEVCQDAHHSITVAILVGGFAASDWLYQQLESKLRDQNIELWRPDRHTNKAVSDGGASFYIDKVVKVRVSKATYGSKVFVNYRENSSKLAALKHLVTRSPITGSRGIADVFDIILPKNVQVSETQEFRRDYSLARLAGTRPFGHVSDTLFRYDGTEEKPLWRGAKDPDAYSVACTIEADLSAVTTRVGLNPVTREVYTAIQYEIIILFGCTELKAQLCWKENGIEKRSPAKIIYQADED